MEDNNAHSDVPNNAKKSRKLNLKNIKLNPKTIAAFAVVVVLAGTFLAGSRYGANKQKTADKTNTLTSRSSSVTSRRWTSVGTIVEVSESKIKVKDSRDQEKEAVITKETKIVSRKGETVAAKDLKKDSRVIVSGTKDEKDDKKLTATRIRLQQ